MIVKALSLWEPYASLIAMGHKTIETRRWYTHFRGPLLICAAKTRNIAVRQDIGYFQSERWCKSLWGKGPLLSEDFKPQLGKAVALCRVIDCRELKGFYTKESCVLDTNGLYGMFLEGIKRLEPFDIRGGQRFFNVELPYEVFYDFEKV